MGTTVRVRALVSGRVQGVFFRDTCRQTATRLGLGGWVRNLRDGRVEIEAEGERGAIERLLAWAREGPPHARVDSVELTDLDLVGDGRGFEVR